MPPLAIWVVPLVVVAVVPVLTHAIRRRIDRDIANAEERNRDVVREYEIGIGCHAAADYEACLRAMRYGPARPSELSRR